MTILKLLRSKNKQQKKPFNVPHKNRQQKIFITRREYRYVHCARRKALCRHFKVTMARCFGGTIRREPRYRPPPLWRAYQKRFRDSRPVFLLRVLLNIRYTETFCFSAIFNCLKYFVSY